MNRIVYFIAAILLGGPSSQLLAADPSVDSPAERVNASAPKSRWYPPRYCTANTTFLPKLSYTGTRGWGVGLQMVRPFQCPGSSPSSGGSEFRLKTRLTTKDQALVEGQLALALSENYSLKTKASYNTLKRYFYGIGPDTPESGSELYKPQESRAYIEFSRHLGTSFQVGARLEAQRTVLLEVEEEGELAERQLRGSRGRRSVGAGMVFDWDKRDDAYAPSRGFKLEGSGLFFDESIGSEFDSNIYHFDARAYLPVREDQVLALQVFTFAARGNAPVWQYAEMGGRSHSRGYRRGRYRDRVLVTAQAEYRVHLFGRLGFAGFFGVSDVAPRYRNLELEYMKSNFGGGPRIAIGSGANAVRARFDIAFGGDTVRYYASLLEAF